MQVLGSLIRESDDEDAFGLPMVAAQLIADAIAAQTLAFETQNAIMNAKMERTIAAIEALAGMFPNPDTGSPAGTMNFSEKEKSGLVGAFS